MSDEEIRSVGWTKEQVEQQKELDKANRKLLEIAKDQFNKQKNSGWHCKVCNQYKASCSYIKCMNCGKAITEENKKYHMYAFEVDFSNEDVTWSCKDPSWIEKVKKSEKQSQCPNCGEVTGLHNRYHGNGGCTNPSSTEEIEKPKHKQLPACPKDDSGCSECLACEEINAISEIIKEVKSEQKQLNMNELQRWTENSTKDSSSFEGCIEPSNNGELILVEDYNAKLDEIIDIDLQPQIEFWNKETLKAIIDEKIRFAILKHEVYLGIKMYINQRLKIKVVE